MLFLCPLDCLSAWGCACCVEKLTCRACKHVWCFPLSLNVKNPLWCCSEPLGWAASFGQLHTVMALVGNGANPHSKNAAGNNAFDDAGREGHGHVVSWLEAWEAAGKPRPGGAPANQRMKREGNAESGGGGGGFDADDTQGCYVGACFLPIFVTAFYVQSRDKETIVAQGLTLPFVLCPWSFDLKRPVGSTHKFELRASDQNQDWSWHSSGCCLCATPGWWAVKVVPTSCCR